MRKTIAMTRGKITQPVYVYLVPKDKWPKRVVTSELKRGTVYGDYDAKTQELLGYEFLDCYGIEIDGEVMFRV